MSCQEPGIPEPGQEATQPGTDGKEPPSAEHPSVREMHAEPVTFEPPPALQRAALLTMERVGPKNELRAQPLIIGRDGTISYGLPIVLPLDKYTYKEKWITTVDESALYIVRFASETGPYTIEQISLFGLQSKAKHQLQQRRPTALFARKGQLYVGGIEGTKTRVDTIDFNQTPPRYVERYTASLSFRQEVDEFAVVGNRLIAIDDVIVPKYGFVFAIDELGRYVKHLFTNHLPVTIDGAYAEGTARGDQLYLREQFTNQHGHGKGQSLLRLQVTGADFREQASLAEYVPNNPQPGAGTQLLSGETFTLFQGMELLGDVLLVGAGERGIIAVPWRFRGDTKATRLALEGSCTDLTSVSGHVFGLLQAADRTELVWLGWDQAARKVEILHRLTLKGRPTRFPK